jgi:hypothetical protein
MCNEISRTVRFLSAGFDNFPDAGTRARLWMDMAKVTLMLLGLRLLPGALLALDDLPVIFRVEPWFGGV